MIFCQHTEEYLILFSNRLSSRKKDRIGPQRGEEKNHVSRFTQHVMKAITGKKTRTAEHTSGN